MARNQQHASRGWKHHVDSRVTCPQDGKEFLTHTAVTERPDGSFVVTFISKQNGKWGGFVVPGNVVKWADTKTALDPQLPLRPEPADLDQAVSDAMSATE